MIGIRKLAGFLLALAFALPAVAHYDDETFSLTMAPALSTGAPASVTAKIKNTGSDDRIKSFKLTVPGGVTVNTATAPGVAASNISIASGVVSIKSVSISGGNSLTVTLGVTFTGVTGCGSSTFKWGAQAWENSTWSGEKFTLDGNSQLYTNISGVCNYSFVVSPTSAAMGATSPMTATVTNAGASTSSITSATIAAPAGFMITAATPTSGTITTTLPANSIAISTLSIAPGSSLGVSLQVSVPCGAAASPNNWGSTAATSFTATSPVQSTTVTGACTLTINAPTSAAVDVPFTVTVGLIGGPGTAPVTLTGSGCGSFTTNPVNGVGGVATFTGLTFSSAGAACVLSATAPNYDVKTKSLPTYAAGNLDCTANVANPPLESTIIGSAVPGLTINDPGFAEGVRALNIVKPDKPNCVPVNWAFTNNVLGGAAISDAKGNTVPPNGVSFVWDQVSQPNAAYSYTVTWKPEWFGIGSPNNRVTKFCDNAACSTATAAQVCLSPALLETSLPVGAKGCITAEVWAVVPAAQCALAVPAQQPDQPACVVFSTTFTDIFDPVWNRP